MVLRGGGGGGRGRGSGGSAKSETSQKLSREQWEALDLMVEWVKRGKKKKPKEFGDVENNANDKNWN